MMLSVVDLIFYAGGAWIKGMWARHFLIKTAESEPGSTTSTALNQQHVQKRANSPRLQQSAPTKRSKEELNKGSQNLSSSWQQKNGHYPAS